MGTKTVLRVPNATYPQVISSQFLTLGDFVKDSVVAPIDPIYGLIGKTIDQYNALSNVSNGRGSVISPLFISANYVKPVLFSSASNYELVSGGSPVYPNASDSPTITIPANTGDVYVELVHLSGLAYGWVSYRYIVGASGYSPSQYQYSKIFEHNAGFDIANISELIFFHTGLSVGTSNNATGVNKDTNITMQSANSSTGVYAGYPRYNNYGGTFNNYLNYSTSPNFAKALCKTYLFFAGVFTNIAGTDQTIFLFHDGATSNKVIQISNSGGKVRISGSYNSFDTKLLNGGNTTVNGATVALPDVDWTESLTVELRVETDGVYLRINNCDDITLTRSSGTIITSSYWTGTILDTITNWKPLNLGSVNSSRVWGSNLIQLGASIPSGITLEKIRTQMKRYAGL